MNHERNLVHMKFGSPGNREPIRKIPEGVTRQQVRDFKREQRRVERKARKSPITPGVP